MKPTIRDVAKHAGVSVATVSRYLNHSPLIAQASVEKVKQAIEELEYQPSMMARGLLHGNSSTIALAIDDTNVETYSNDYFLRIQYGLEHELVRNGYYLMICHIGHGKHAVKTIEKIVNEKRIDGLVLLNELAQPSIVEYLDNLNFPYVIAGRRCTNDCAWVDIDNIEAGKCATQWLLDSGAKNIGFVANSFQKTFVKERYEGYLSALNCANLHLNAEHILDGLYTAEDIVRYFEANKNQLCEAYVASDSLIAYLFLRELSRRGIQVPQEVQVIAFDDTFMAEISEPAMTVVKIDVTSLGMMAAKLLMKQLQAGQRIVEQKLYPVCIVERGSTKPH